MKLNILANKSHILNLLQLAINFDYKNKCPGEKMCVCTHMQAHAHFFV